MGCLFSPRTVRLKHKTRWNTKSPKSHSYSWRLGSSNLWKWPTKGKARGYRAADTFVYVKADFVTSGSPWLHASICVAFFTKPGSSQAFQTLIETFSRPPYCECIMNSLRQAKLDLYIYCTVVSISLSFLMCWAIKDAVSSWGKGQKCLWMFSVKEILLRLQSSQFPVMTGFVKQPVYSPTKYYFDRFKKADQTKLVITWKRDVPMWPQPYRIKA